MKKVVVFVDEPSVSNAVHEILAEQKDLVVETAAAVADMEKLAGPNSIVLTDLPDSSLAFLPNLRESGQIALPASVVILTSQRNEHLALQALREGAISYVPIRLLDVELLKTIHSVFGVLSAHDGRLRILECLTTWHSEFSLANDSSLIGPLVRYMQESTQRLGLLCDPGEETRMGVALEEALLNSMYHGNLEVPSELREDDDSKFYEMVDQRRSESPYKDRRVVVRAEFNRERAVFRVRDEGPGFDVSSIPDPTDPNNIERVSGRGMLLMRTFMDRVEYNELGNEVSLTKRRQPCD